MNGPDLGKFIKLKTKLSRQQALPIIHQIAAALDHAHAAGIVHRDIKPSNVMLDQSSGVEDRAVLTDFGIAKIIDASTMITRSGGILGTFDYAAPEQIQASPNIDGRADIYALGIMVFQMLAGELPFKHQNVGALLIAHLNQPPPDIGEIDPSLWDIAGVIQKAMAKRAEERFATATEFAQVLDASQVPVS